jgi:hypothetical protein
VDVIHGLLLTPGDRGLAALAERQHGVVSAAQLRVLGIGRGAVDCGSGTGDSTRFIAASARSAIRG